MTQQKNILVFRPLPEDQLARLQAAHHVTVADPRKEPEAFAAALRTADGLIGSSHPVDAALLDAAPQLQVISSVSVGVDNYPLAELRKRGIVLCHTPDVLTETVADTVFAILMATQRRVVELSNLVREGRWTKNIGEELFGTDVHGKTLGIQYLNFLFFCHLAPLFDQLTLLLRHNCFYFCHLAIPLPPE
eukprot:gene10452-biopygen8756